MHAKRIYLAKRNPALARENFPARWRQHAALPKPGLSKGMEYVGLAYCYVEDTPFDADDGAGPFDGVALIELKGLQSVVTALGASPKDGPIIDDELQTFDRRVREFSMAFWSEILQDGPAGDWTLFRFARRAPDCQSTPFRHAWRSVADRILANPPPGLQRYVQNTTVTPPPEGYDYDGVEELWFETRSQALAAADRLMALSQDVADQIDLARSRSMVTRVVHRKDPAAIALTSAAPSLPG